jgi:hypothetical protein
MQWKLQTFLDLQRKPFIELIDFKDRKINKNLKLCSNFKLKPECLINLIVVGDSTNEMRAGLELHDYLQGESFSDNLSH